MPLPTSPVAPNFAVPVRISPITRRSTAPRANEAPACANTDTYAASAGWLVTAATPNGRSNRRVCPVASPSGAKSMPSFPLPARMPGNPATTFPAA